MAGTSITATSIGAVAASSMLAANSSMQRIVCSERDDWRATAEAAGFDFHTIDGERYWDERAYYAFTLDEIERQIETPTGEIDAMCLELVGKAVADEEYLRRLKIPESYWPLIADSWHDDQLSLYGRIDLSFGGQQPAKLLEYNADTPTSIFEAAVFQWTWLEQAIERNIVPKRADQFNSIHEQLIEAWKKLGATQHLHLAGMLESSEDSGTLAYLEDTARQAGLATTLLDIQDIGLSDDERFVDLGNRPIELAFKLYPWEWMFHDAFGARDRKGADALDRAAMEGDPLQQGRAAAAVGNVSGTPEPAAGLFRGRPESRPTRHVLRSQAALFARGRQRDAGQRRHNPDRAGRPLRRGRIHPPGAGAAAEFFRTVPGDRQLAGRSHAVRPIDPRGRESDHRQYVAVCAARDSLKSPRDRSENHGTLFRIMLQRAEATAFSGIDEDVATRNPRAAFGAYMPRRSG